MYAEWKKAKPGTCTRPPEGWFCIADEGHEGPCAAWPTDPRDLPIEYKSEKPPKPYWSWRAWVRWCVPLALLVRYSKRNFASHVWYQDEKVRLQLVIKEDSE